MFGLDHEDESESFSAAHKKELLAIHAARKQYRIDRSDSKNHFVGLALSGGGIRSATFSLGVLQAIAKHSKLTSFDYLSTVSGGGYIGSWLSAWINRDGLLQVEAALKPRPAEPGKPSEPDTVIWLRKYSNYLAPKLGLLSGDSLTLIATWTRNVLLNLIIFVSMLAVIFLIPRALMPIAITTVKQYSDELGYAAAWFGFFIFPVAISFNLSRVALQDSLGRVNWVTTTSGVFTTVIVPAVLATVFGSLSIFSTSSSVTSHFGGLAAGTVALLAVAGMVWLPNQFKKQKLKWSMLWEGLAFALAYSVALTVAFFMAMATIAVLRNKGVNDLEKTAVIVAFGPPALLATFGVCGSIIVGLVGRVYYERSREWWGRLNAWLAIITLCWLVWFGLSFYALPLIEWIDASSSGWFKAIGGIGWLSTLLTTLLIPKPANTKTVMARLGSKALDLAASVVVAGFLVIVAALTAYTLREIAIPSPSAPESTHVPTDFRVSIWKNGQTTQAALKLTESKTSSLEMFVAASFKDQIKVGSYPVPIASNFCQPGDSAQIFLCRWSGYLPDQVHLPDAALVVCTLIFLVFGFRVDVNKFSLHNLYKNRLVRCYLGASRCKQRNAQPFTGFDEHDDVSIARLRAEVESNNIQRPLHIINAAINITHGTNLAWQERKAASFTLTPWHCGFSLGASTGDAPQTPVRPWDIDVLRSQSSEGDLSSSELQAESRFSHDKTSAPINRALNCQKSTEAYRDSKGYASEKDEAKRFTLGMAMATSGAAVSPSMGMNTSPALAFLLTLFNIRLGRWSPNPAQRYWRRSSPWFGLRLLLQELFGLANERSDFVYLSDGGHFDNTGIYELVRRQCMTILAVDAGADFRRSFADLANLVRKCRVDFGVDIHIELDKFGTKRAEEADSRGYAIGTIDYGPCKNERSEEMAGKRKIGKLIVIKPTLMAIKNLGVDVFSYSRNEELFPQQSTIDQFFDESQFESYRALGFCITDKCLADKECELPVTSEAQN